MKNISIFINDEIRMHPNNITVDGLGIAVAPYIIFPLKISDQEFEIAFQQCLEHSKTDVPHQPWQKVETANYYKSLRIKSQKDLGQGVNVTLENDVYTVIPVDKKGRFGNPVETNQNNLLEIIKECLGLLPVHAE